MSSFSLAMILIMIFHVLESIRSRLSLFLSRSLSLPIKSEEICAQVADHTQIESNL